MADYNTKEKQAAAIRASEQRYLVREVAKSEKRLAERLAVLYAEDNRIRSAPSFPRLRCTLRELYRCIYGGGMQELTPAAKKRIAERMQIHDREPATYLTAYCDVNTVPWMQSIVKTLRRLTEAVSKEIDLPSDDS